jgi:hypothetical protein
MVGSQRIRHGPHPVRSPRWKSKTHLEMGVRLVAAGRHYLGVFPAFTDVGTAGTYPVDAYLVLCFFPAGLYVYRRVMP